MHILGFERFLENELNGVIEEAYPLTWDENYISHTFANRLKSKLGSRTISITGSRYPFSIAWEFYKLRRTPERDHGDIGILVRRKILEGKIIEGAGFLEAKLRDIKTGRFKQVKTKQSNRILARSPQTQMLLYDHNPVAVLDFHTESLPWDWFPFVPEPDSTSVVSCGPVLPFALAIAIGKFDSSLYRFCHSFGQQFTRRYFNLLDLDFRTNSINAVKGFPGRFDSPNIVMTIRIGQREDSLPDAITLNREVYSLIE